MLDHIANSFDSSFGAMEARIASGTQASYASTFVLRIGSYQVPDFLNAADYGAIYCTNMAYFAIVAMLYAICKRRERGGATAPKLRWVLRAYNAICVALAFYVVQGLLRHKLAEMQLGRSSFVCNGVEHESTAVRKNFAYVVWVYYAQKYWEMLDTLFFIARFSWRQVTFLHVYHHSSITAVTALFLTLDASGDLYLPALLNSFIHVLMYSHYFLSSFGFHCWWKKYLTMLQLLQFAICWSQPLISLYYGPSWYANPLLLSLNCLVTVLRYFFWIAYAHIFISPPISSQPLTTLDI